MKHDPDCPFSDQVVTSCWCLTAEDGITVGPPKANITFGDSSLLTVQTSTKVTVKDALVLRHGGQEVRMDATYDFADVPPEMHLPMLQMLMWNRRVLSYV